MCTENPVKGTKLGRRSLRLGVGEAGLRKIVGFGMGKHENNFFEISVCLSFILLFDEQ